jgi:hypothetical protein
MEDLTELLSKLNEQLNLVAKELTTVNQEITLIKKELKTFSKKEDQVNGHIEVIKKLTHERLSTGTSQSTLNFVAPIDNNTSVVNSGPEKNPKKTIIIENYNDYSAKIYGKTFDYNYLIKQINGKQWVPEDKCWTIPLESVDLLKKLFDDNKVEYVCDILPTSSIVFSD